MLLNYHMRRKSTFDLATFSSFNYEPPRIDRTDCYLLLRSGESRPNLGSYRLPPPVVPIIYFLFRFLHLTSKPSFFSAHVSASHLLPRIRLHNAPLLRIFIKQFYVTELHVRICGELSDPGSSLCGIPCNGSTR
jgi:hypothetical protein